MYKRISQYFYAIKNLKIRQIIYRIRKDFIKRIPYRLELDHSIPGKNINIKFLQFSYKVYKNNNKIFFFKLFDKKLHLNKKINWNNKIFTDLEIYHLNYFDFLFEINQKNHGLCVVQVIDWIKKNTKKKLKSLDPYPTSLRIVNWIKFMSYNKIENEKINFSLKSQVSHLRNNLEYDIDGNHLMANAKALIFASFYFQDKNLFKFAEKIYLDCLEEQTLPDGAHFERSPMYHSIICNDLIELIDLYKKNNIKFYKSDNIKTLKKYFQKYINWYSCITNFDGSPPFFNDTNFSNSLNLNYLIKKAKKILKKNILDKKNFAKDIVYFKNSGFLIYKNIKKNFFFVADVGSIKAHFQPGHSSAGIFSFELTYANRRFFVNTGVSTYADNSRRFFEKSSISHNTISLNKLNNQDIWRSFRVGKRTIVKLDRFLKNKHSQIFSFNHNGFKNHIHHREFEFSDNSVRIKDKISNYNKKLQISSNLGLHPKVFIYKDILKYKNTKIRYKFINCRTKLKNGYWSPKFNTNYHNKKFQLKQKSDLCMELFFNF